MSNTATDARAIGDDVAEFSGGRPNRASLIFGRSMLRFNDCLFRLGDIGLGPCREQNQSAWQAEAPAPHYRLHTGQIGYLSALPDGRITVKAIYGSGVDSLLLFDPGTSTFQPVAHPEGRRINFAWRRPDGSLWVATSSPCRLEIYDGKTLDRKSVV